MPGTCTPSSVTMAADPTEVRPKRVRMASTAAVTSCHDCSRAWRSRCASPTPSPRSNDSWSATGCPQPRGADAEQADALPRVDGRPAAPPPPARWRRPW